MFWGVVRWTSVCQNLATAITDKLLALSDAHVKKFELFIFVCWFAYHNMCFSCLRKIQKWAPPLAKKKIKNGQMSTCEVIGIAFSGHRELNFTLHVTTEHFIKRSFLVPV